MSLQKIMIPHVYQSTDYSCGAACMKMALASLGIRRTERELIRVMKTTSASGTSNSQIPRAAEFFRLSYVVGRKAKIGDIVRLQKEGYCVIVNYIDLEENVGHFAVAKSIDKKFIHLLDPWHGPHYKLPLTIFKKNWKSMFEPDVGLLIGIRK